MTKQILSLPRSHAPSPDRAGASTRLLGSPPVATRPARMSDEAGVRFAAAEAALALTAVTTAALALPTATRLVVLGAVVVVAALVLPWAAALGAAATAWAVWTGFAEHHLGQLTLAPGDLERLAVLVAVATAGVVLHGLVRPTRVTPRAVAAGGPRG